MFWRGHDPTYAKGSQYRAALFCHDDEQLVAARRTATALEAEIGERVVTEITTDKPFFSAEAYHQKWRLRQKPALFQSLLGHYPDEPAMLASTAAAKANAYVGGHGDLPSLERDLPLLTQTA